MDAPLAAAYARVKDRMSEAEFLDRIAREREAFDGLLDDEALALLVLDEEGLNEGAYVTLGELAGRAEATVRVAVDAVDPIRTFARNGREGRVANVQVSDATGRARLVLWDRDVEKVEDGTLRVGARVTVVNARVKEGRWGVELHVSPWSALDVEGALDPAKRKLLQDVQDDGAAAPAATRDVAGLLLARGPTRTYRDQDGSVGFECDLDLETAEGRARVVLRGQAVRAAQRVGPGQPVTVTACAARVRGATTEWHATDVTELRGAS